MESPSSVTQSVLISVFVLTVLLGGGFLAYNAGYLDPLIEKIGAAWFKAEAIAEKKKLEAQGLKAGEDFVDDELSGNKKAGELVDGVGGLGGLKKEL